MDLEEIALPKQPTEFEPIGTTLRDKRVKVLEMSLREMADALGITSAHLSDLEKGRRTPSEDLLLRIKKHYQIREGVLRSGWGKLDSVIERVGTRSPDTAERASAFMAAAETLSPAQWDTLIEQARRMSPKPGGRSS